MIELLKQLYPLMKYQTVKDYCERSQNNGLLTLNEIIKNLPDAVSILNEVFNIYVQFIFI